jgi:hypothetical protein
MFYGMEGVARHDERRFAMGILASALGGGMSSRLFQEIREKRGLAYSVYAYAQQFAAGEKEKAILPYVHAAETAKQLGLGVNAGHDLDLHNLAWFNQHIPWLDEVSIGHALIADALYYGLENTVQLYQRQLVKS